jgi:hypothetical protein
MWAKNRTRTHVLRNVGERSSRARVAKELAIRLSARTRQSRNPTSKRYIPAWSSQFSSSVSVSPHPSTPISQTPNQPTNVEPTRHTHSLPRGALHTSCSPPRQLRPLPWFAGVGAAPSPTSGGSERRRSAPPQRSPARAGGAPCPVAPCGGEEVVAADGYSRPRLGKPGGGRARRVLPAAAAARLLPGSPLPPLPSPSSATPLPHSFPQIEWLEPWRWRRVPLPLRRRLPLLWRPRIEQSTTQRLDLASLALAGGPEDGSGRAPPRAPSR